MGLMAIPEMSDEENKLSKKEVKNNKLQLRMDIRNKSKEIMLFFQRQ